jgi:hypothetical protein
LDIREQHRLEASRRAVRAAIVAQHNLAPNLGDQAVLTGAMAAVFEHAMQFFQSQGKSASQATLAADALFKAAGDNFIQLGATIQREPANTQKR